MDLLTNPYASARSSALATNGMVATSQPLAAQAGLRMLLQGGNAVDATIATAVALTVVEPTCNGIGGDAFALVWDDGKLHGLNGSGRWPAGMEPQRLRNEGHAAIPHVGWPSVTVPGAPAAWYDLHERFGKLPLDDVMAPAIDYAEQGFAVTPLIANLWREAFTDLNLRDGWRDTFTRDGRPPKAGERWFSSDHARTLRLMAERGPRDFYEGELAERLLSFSRQSGGVLVADDLASHRSEWVEPIKVSYRDHDIWEIPPNGQGLAVLQALGILERTDVAQAPFGSADQWHLQMEAMKLALADAYRYVADPVFGDSDLTRRLLDKTYLAQRRRLITDNAGDPGPGLTGAGGTVYLCAADRDGMMVSFIQSNYSGFGSGLVVPGYGIALHNRAACFRLDAGHANSAQPGKRPRHTILPGFISKGGEAVGPFGVMGKEMQPQGQVQVACGLLDHGMNPQAILDAPRWQVVGGKRVWVEPETDTGLVAALRRRGHRIEVVTDRLEFGRGQVILKSADGVYVGGTEPRADGAVVGY